LPESWWGEKIAVPCIGWSEGWKSHQCALDLEPEPIKHSSGILEKVYGWFARPALMRLRND
jgi:hypothetical protein